MLRVSSRCGGSRGASAVEMTLVMPLLLMLLMGIIEMSVVLYDQAMITNACREGARFGILYNVDSSGTYTPMTEAQIQAVVNNYLADRLISFSPGSATTTVSGGTSSGTLRTVNVQYTYDFLILPNFVESFTGDLTLSAQAVMRME